MRKVLIASAIFIVAILVTSGSLYAQAASTPTVPDKDLELLRRDLRSMKKQIVAANLQLTDVEAQQFWPIYDRYTAAASKIYDARYAVIKEYAANFRNLSDAQASGMARRWTDLDASMVQLRLKYLPTFEKVISGKRTALFYQVDRRLALMIDLQLASEIPLVQP